MQIKEREPIDFIHAMMEAVAVKTEVEGIHFRNSTESIWRNVPSQETESWSLSIARRRK